TLKREIHFRKGVIGIRSERDSAEVHCQDGTVYKAKRVICTIPLPVQRFVHFDPVLPEAQTTAIKTVPYEPMTQVHITFTDKFWLADGGSPAMWTDCVFGSVACNRFNRDNDEVTSLTAWGRGFCGIRLDQYPEEDAKKLVISEIERI